MGGHKERNSEKRAENAYKGVQISRRPIQHTYAISSSFPCAFNIV